MSDENRRVTKVKRSDKSIIIHHHHANKNYDKDTDTMLRHEPALPSFHDAFNALIPDVAGILEMDEKYTQDIKVSQIVLKWDDDRITNVVISSQKTLSTTNGVFRMHTPVLSEAEEGKDTGKVKTLPSTTAAKIRALCDEALAFADGKRAQLTLDLSAEADREKELRVKAAKYMIEAQRSSVEGLGRRLNLDAEKAREIMEEFEDLEMVGAPDKRGMRDMLVMDLDEAKEILAA